MQTLSFGQRTENFGQNSVDHVVEEIPEASHVLRSYNVDVTASHGLPVSEVAKTVSASTDDMLAVMEYRLRRAARQMKK